MGYINGLDREQIWLCPAVVDDYMDEAHPVRFLEVYVDGRDLEARGVKYATPKATGRPPYHPGDLLKRYRWLSAQDSCQPSSRARDASQCRIEVVVAQAQSSGQNNC